MLTELARHSLLATRAAWHVARPGSRARVVEPLSRRRARPTETETWALRMQPTDLLARRPRRSASDATCVDGLTTLATAPSTTSTAHCAPRSTRRPTALDPWATAIAWRRLQALAAAPRTLGVYGWVDAPRPATSDGDHRFVLAPSAEQAAVAAVLRDRALHDPDADRWQIDLTSDAVRGALRSPPRPARGAIRPRSLGQMVEAIVGVPT